MVLTLQCYSQSPVLEQMWEAGVPLITNYSSEHYHASLQNWGIAQGSNGTMYFANNSGILTFNGARWSTVQLPNNLNVRSLKSSQGKIFIGGNNEIGFIREDAAQEGYHSLRDRVPKASVDFGRVWSTHEVHDTIYFISSRHVFKSAGDYFEALPVPDSSSISFSWSTKENCYVTIKRRGVVKIVGNQFVDIKYGRELAARKATTMLPYNDNHLLVTGSDKHVYLYNDLQLAPLVLNGDRVTLPAEIYYAIQLSNGDFAFATLNDGIIVMDKGGKIKSHLKKINGLPSDAVYTLFEDRDGNLWAGSENGISYIELSSPIRRFDEAHGIHEIIADVQFYNNAIYATNSKGVLISKTKGNQVSFSPLDGIEGQTLDCFEAGDKLWVSNTTGLFSLNANGELAKVANDRYVRIEAPLTPVNTNFYFGTLENKISFVDFSTGSAVVKELGQIGKAPEELIRTAGGKLLLNTKKEVFKVDLNNHSGNAIYSPKLIQLPVDLPVKDDPLLSIGKNGFDQVFLSADNRFYNFDLSTEQFHLNNSISNYLSKFEGLAVRDIIAGTDSTFWLRAEDQLNGQTALFKGTSSRIEEERRLRRINDVFITRIEDTRLGFLFICTNKGLMLFRCHNPGKSGHNLKTVIDDPIVNDSIKPRQEQPGLVILPYEERNLRFTFSIPSYEKNEQNTFQYQLKGYDKSWSKWSTASSATYTNLREGKYILHVRGKNVFDDMAASAVFKIEIKPPWYRTTTAYMVYSICSVALIIGLVQWRSFALRKEQRRLETIISERTRQLTIQAEELKEMDKMKTRFFANISHELRTPITLILAPLEVELKKSTTSNPNLQLVKQNADRLLQLVSQLLDATKIDSGEITLDLRKDSLVDFLKSVTDSFYSIAHQKHITFESDIALIGEHYKFDHDKLQKIISNLLTNALKFTDPGGKVCFEAKSFFIGDYEWLELYVSDSGRGIPEDEHEKIFQPFYQASNNNVGDGGTGIGLSLVKELVKLYHGKIHFESKPGEGTTFKIFVPVDDRLL